MEKRIDYLDYVKGILIILVFFGHLTSEKFWWRKIIFSVALPAFFIISGMVMSYKKRVKGEISGTVNSNIRGIVWPYICFSFVYVVKEYCTTGFDLSVAKDAFIRQCSFWKGCMWFLPTLFGAKTLAELLIQMATKYIKMIIAIGICVLSISSNIIQYGDFFKIIEKTTVWYMVNFVNKVLIGVVFILIGFITFPIQTFPRKKVCIISIVGIMACACLAQCTGMIDLNNSKIYNPIFFWINAIVGTECLILLFTQVNEKLEILKFFGKNSLIMMATTSVFPIISISKVLAEKLGKENNFFVIGIVGIIMEYFMIWIIDKYFPWMKKMPRRKTYAIKPYKKE